MLILVEDTKGLRSILNTNKIIRAVDVHPVNIEEPVQIIVHLDHYDGAISFSKIAHVYHDQSVKFEQIKSLTDFYLYLSEMQNQN